MIKWGLQDHTDSPIAAEVQMLDRAEIPEVCKVYLVQSIELALVLSWPGHRRRAWALFFSWWWAWFACVGEGGKLAKL